MFVTSGTVADCRLGEKLIQGADADYLLADKGYDSDGRAKSIEREKEGKILLR